MERKDFTQRAAAKDVAQNNLLISNCPAVTHKHTRKLQDFKKSLW